MLRTVEKRTRTVNFSEKYGGLSTVTLMKWSDFLLQNIAWITCYVNHTTRLGSVRKVSQNYAVTVLVSNVPCSPGANIKPINPY